MRCRVVLIVSSFPKLSETFIASKFLGLFERGWDVRVVCNESSEAQMKHFPELASRSGIRQRVKTSWPHRPQWLAVLLSPFALFNCLWRNPIGTMRYLHLGFRRFGFGVLRRLYLDAAVLALKPDLIHFEFGAPARERMYLKELLDCKVVVSFRGYDLNYCGLETSRFYEDVWNQADRLHLLGEDLWRRAQLRGCPAAKPHTLIAPAIDPKRFAFKRAEARRCKNSGSSTLPFRVLSVGRLEWKKGYEYAIQAIGMLRDAGIECEYRIVGDGSFLEPLSYARRQLGLAAKVHFVGALSPQRVRDYMKESDIFLHAAVSEGFCNAVLEAQSMELPVVCTDADGLRENVSDDETGFVVPRRNPWALADKLIQLARNPDLRRRMGKAGRLRVRKNFALSQQTEAFSEMYRLTLSDDAPRESQVRI